MNSGTSVNEIQVNPGTTVVPTTSTTPVDEIEIGTDPGMAAPLATPTAPSGLEVNSLNLSTSLNVKFVLIPGPR